MEAIQAMLRAACRHHRHKTCQAFQARQLHTSAVTLPHVELPQIPCLMNPLPIVLLPQIGQASCQELSIVPVLAHTSPLQLHFMLVSLDW